MKHLRAVLRLLAILLVTAVCFLGYLATRPLALIAPHAAARCHSFWIRRWSRAAVRILRVAVAVRGSPPPAPFLLACNHLSYLDVVTLWSRVECRFLAKADVARWPLVGLLARAVGTHFIHRERKKDLPRVLRGLRDALAAGRSVAFFPEGTSSDGRGVLPFRSSLFETAVALEKPVHCARISYATPASGPPAAAAVCWWGDMTFADHFYRLLQLPRCEALIAFAAQPIAGADRKLLAQAAHLGVCGLPALDSGAAAR